MGRESKSVMLNRISMLSQKMAEGLNYNECLEWYVKEFNKSESMFNKDRTIIYRQWKIEVLKSIEEDMVELLKNIEADRKLARELGNAGAAIQANKLVAQLKGLLNKQGDVLVQNNTLNLNFENISTEEIKKILHG